jgi:hypothetical protein
MERSREFVAEGSMEVGSYKQLFLFLDGEHLGELLLRHRRLAETQGITQLGRVRVTVDWLDKELTEETSPT